MRKTKRTRVTVETERLLVISRKGMTTESWCQDCGAMTRMIGLDEASAVSGQSQRQIARSVVLSRAFSSPWSWRSLL